MSEEQAVEKKRSKRIYIMWAAALGMLLAAGLFCWLVVVPVWRTHSVLAETEALTAIGKAINNCRQFSADRQTIDIMQGKS